MKQRLPLRGTFALKVYKNGKLVERYVEKNLIVDAGFDLVQQLLSSAAADKHVTKIAFGDLTTPEVAETDPEWTGVPDPIEINTGENWKTFDSVTFPTARSISFNWSLQGNQANGNDIAYFGLLSEDETLFAAKSRPAIAKTEDIVLQGTWIINF
jgi:hypothetical protein